VGYVLRNGRAELTDFFAVITNKYAWLEFFHVVPASLLLAGFFIVGISAWHLLRKSNTEFFRKSFNLGISVALVFALFTAAEGHIHGNNLSDTQPAKLAAMESHWKTETQAPMYLLVVPGQDGNYLQALPLPGVLSFLAYNDFNAEVKGLSDFPTADRPPVVISFLSFRLMVGLGTLFILLAGFGFLVRKKIDQYPRLLKALPFCIPLPYIAIWAGWTLTEVGRQPWIVYGLMRTSDAVSPVGAGEVGFTLVLMTVLYALLGAVGIWLMVKLAKKGPEDNTPIQA
jgi:cytochrome d ubiquinol oxidase subunit I